MKQFEWVLISVFMVSGICAVVVGFIYPESNLGWHGGIMITVGSLYWRVKDLEDKQ